MKISQVIRAFAVLIVSAVLSCQERKEITPNTLPCPDAVVAKTPEQILTGNAWKIEQIRFVHNNIYRYYKRGGSAALNTDNYDIEYIEFLGNNTGTYYNEFSVSTPITWSFVNSEKTIIRYTIQYPCPITVTWENMIFSEKSIRYTEYYTLNNIVNSLGSGTRIPR